MILTFFFHSIGDFNHDILKQFILQIRIGYLGRLWVSDPPMDLRIGIKYLNPMEMGESKILPKSYPLPSLI